MNIKIKKGIFNYILLSIMAINIMLIVIIDIASFMLEGNGLIFKNWVTIFMLRNKWCLIFTFIVFLIAYFLKKIKSTIGKILLIVVSVIFIGVLSMLSILDVEFSKKYEFQISKNGQEVIAETSGFLGTTCIEFYTPVNDLVMKVTEIPSERYEHGNNPYRDYLQK